MFEILTYAMLNDKLSLFFLFVHNNALSCLKSFGSWNEIFFLYLETSVIRLGVPKSSKNVTNGNNKFAEIRKEMVICMIYGACIDV